MKQRMAIGRLIAEALLKGEHVDIPGLGVFRRDEEPATVHEHGDRRIWMAPRARVVLGHRDDAPKGGSR
ncbi:MAG: hypothetical protein O3C45_05655 [Bacteroidetes bacterium]|nr:hypothetical protein [Bacteroidota bacterium]